MDIQHFLLRVQQVVYEYLKETIISRSVRGSLRSFEVRWTYVIKKFTQTAENDLVSTHFLIVFANEDQIHVQIAVQKYLEIFGDCLGVVFMVDEHVLSRFRRHFGGIFLA